MRRRKLSGGRRRMIIIALVATVACLLLVYSLRNQPQQHQQQQQQQTERSVRLLVPISAPEGVGHRFASMLIGELMARRCARTLAVHPNMFTEHGSEHGAFPEFPQLLDMDYFPEYIIGSEPDLEFHAKTKAETLESDAPIVVASTGFITYCGGKYCMQTWSGAYQEARQFWRRRYVNSPAHKRLPARPPGDTVTRVVWHIRNGDEILRNLKFYVKVNRQLAPLLAHLNVQHTVFSEYGLCIDCNSRFSHYIDPKYHTRVCGNFCPFEKLMRRQNAVFQVNTTINSMLLDMIEADILISSGSSLVSMAAIFASPSQIFMVPRAKPADLDSVYDLEGSVRVDAKGNFDARQVKEKLKEKLQS